jgi:hypothetical protein
MNHAPFLVSSSCDRPRLGIFAGAVLSIRMVRRNLIREPRQPAVRRMRRWCASLPASMRSRRASSICGSDLLPRPDSYCGPALRLVGTRGAAGPRRSTSRQSLAEGWIVERHPKSRAFRKDLGPFVVAAETTRMAMVFTDAKEANHPLIFANDSFCL